VCVRPRALWVVGSLFFCCFFTRVCLAFSCNWEGIENWEVFRKLLACGVVEVEGILTFVEVGRRKNVFCGFCFGGARQRERELGLGAA
jgi:hypothetical protein